MPVDAGLYSQFAPQVQPPQAYTNALMQQDAMRQSQQMNALHLQSQQADFNANQRLRGVLAGGADLSTPEGMAAATQADPIGALKLREQQLGMQKTQAEATKFGAQAGEATAKTGQINLETAQKKTSALAQRVSTLNGPGDVLGFYQQGINDGLIDLPSAMHEMQQIPQDPQGFAQWKAKQQQKGLALADQIGNQIKLQEEQGRNTRSAATNQTSLQSANIHAGATLGAANIGAATSRANNAATIAKDYAVAGLNPADGTPTANQTSLVDAIGQYKVAPPSGLSLRNPRMQAILEQVTSKYPEFDATQYGARQVAAKSFATGKDGQYVQIANTAVNHIDTLRQLAQAQNNGDIQAVNALKNQLSKEFGGVAPANLQAAVTMVGPEISKAVVGAGGGVQDREKVDSALTALTKGSPSQQAGALATIEDIFGGRLTEAQRTYERTTGRKDFATTMLSPSAAQVLARRTGGAQTAALRGGLTQDAISAELAKRWVK